MTLSRARTLMVIAVAAAATAGIAAVWSASASTPAPSPPNTGLTGSQIQQPAPADYWTPERMRDAQPAPMPAPDN